MCSKSFLTAELNSTISRAVKLAVGQLFAQLYKAFLERLARPVMLIGTPCRRRTPTTVKRIRAGIRIGICSSFSCEDPIDQKQGLAVLTLA